MKEYIIYEIGRSAYTEFLMKDDNFEETQDCIVVDFVKANSKNEAYDIVINADEHKNKKFHKLVVKQIL
jgi:hypothetical protein